MTTETKRTKHYLAPALELLNANRTKKELSIKMCGNDLSRIDFTGQKVNFMDRQQTLSMLDHLSTQLESYNAAIEVITKIIIDDTVARVFSTEIENLKKSL